MTTFTLNHMSEWYSPQYWVHWAKKVPVCWALNVNGLTTPGSA